jgi:adenylate cyclase
MLVAVVYADMVGYSRLIGQDDVGTLRRLRSIRINLINPAIEEYGGRLVNTGGDSLLIVLDSVEGAVRCALKIQERVPILDTDQPPDQAIRFRIGINIGDAIHDGADLHGDAVNVAVRLQAECPPGGICLSRAVLDHVHERLGLDFARLGALHLKNIARPVEAFLVRAGTGGAATKAARWSSHSVPDTPPLPDKPSIAVLAFANTSGDIEQEYFSDGIAEDVTTELSRNRELFVISRNSSFTYRSRSTSVQQIGRELGVRYVVEGSVRRVAQQARITVQLIDAATNRHIWAERYDRNVENVFAVQNEIAEAVANAITPAVGDEERQRAIRQPPNSLGAWETYQRGLWHFYKLAPVENLRARELFGRSVIIDPGFASPHVGLSHTYIWDYLYYHSRALTEAIYLGEEEARKAIAIDPLDAGAQRALAHAFVLRGSFHAALDHIDRALALNRNSAAAYRVKGGILILMGQHFDGRACAQESLRLSPRDPLGGFSLSLIATSYYLQGDYEAALTAAERCIVQHPEYASVRRYFVAALAQLGQTERAANALQDLLAVAPGLVDMVIRNRPSYIRPEDHEHILDGLRKAGWEG